MSMTEAELRQIKAEVAMELASNQFDSMSAAERALRELVLPPVFPRDDDGSSGDVVAAWSERVDELTRMSYAKYLQTEEWREQRRRALARAGGRCQGCGDGRHLEVHHVTYDHRGQELPEDLTVFCAACHTAVHLVADGRRGKIRNESRRP